MKKRTRTTLIILVMCAVFLSFFNSQTATAVQKNKDITVSPPICTTAIAAVTDCQVIGQSGGTVGTARLRLQWTYAATGVKPNKLQITVYRLQGIAPGTWDNIMPSAKAFEVPSPATTTVSDVLIWRLFAGKYRFVFKAFYTCNRVKEYTFERTL
jgi:hypothetical protein